MQRFIIPALGFATAVMLLPAASASAPRPLVPPRTVSADRFSQLAATGGDPVEGLTLAGTAVAPQKSFSRITFQFREGGRPATAVPSYEIRYLPYPARVVAVFGGVTGAKQPWKAQKPPLEGTYGFGSADGFTQHAQVYLKSPCEFRLTEQRAQGRLLVDVRPVQSKTPPPASRFAVYVPAAADAEVLFGQLDELRVEGIPAEFVLAKDGRVRVQAGIYATRASAEAASLKIDSYGKPGVADTQVVAQPLAMRAAAAR